MWLPKEKWRKRNREWSKRAQRKEERRGKIEMSKMERGRPKGREKERWPCVMPNIWFTL